MIPIVPPKRRDGKSSFLTLVSYLTLREDVRLAEPVSPDAPVMRMSRSKEAIFDRLVDYIDRSRDAVTQTPVKEFADGRSQVLSGNVACETNCFSLDTASAEMNMVAAQNTRCVDPVYHFILSWPAQDNPVDADIFDCARSAIQALGMKEHQFVTAIHRDTDHVHCHVAVNRINPISYRAANLYNDIDTLHKVCRFLELKYDYTPDNGAWVNENGAVVRNTNDVKSIPRKARQLEYHSDKESLYSYAVNECRERIGEILGSGEASWETLHAELIRAGLDMREKGEGLAIYSRHDENVTPIKASTLHPDLTRQCLDKWLGDFEPSPEVVNNFDEDGVYLGSNYPQEFVYDARAHVRDQGARSERRLARAVAREDLDARYKAYKNAWVRPKMPDTDSGVQFRALSNRYAWKKEQVRYVFDDPLIRKLIYRTLELERQKEFEMLRDKVKAEKTQFYSRPENRRLSYWQWVERQAAAQDQAAISRLRGRAYKLKQKQRTPGLSENAIVCAVADDIATVNIDGFESRVNRDGVIQYLQDGHVVIQDSGERIEIANPYREDGIHISDAMLIAEEKSGEKLVFSGDGRFVNSACDVVQWFNEGGSNPLPLTDPQQRVRAGYERPESSSEQPVFTHRIMDEETYLASLKREDAAATDDRNKPEPGKNTYRPG
ncbi:relaxase/mobilization nuclease domain-containing protein [Salmonella enterica]|nr:relaxase/mobilization nuclease domain-containing protein [Salmonella enterica]ELX6002175.1 relaxase/mobilization nuclease domain-containing protein [Salmonella enterica]